MVTQAASEAKMALLRYFIVAQGWFIRRKGLTFVELPAAEFCFNEKIIQCVHTQHAVRIELEKIQ